MIDNILISIAIAIVVLAAFTVVGVVRNWRKQYVYNIAALLALGVSAEFFLSGFTFLTPESPIGMQLVFGGMGFIAFIAFMLMLVSASRHKAL